MANKKIPTDNASAQNTKLIAETTTVNNELKQQNFELSLAVGALTIFGLLLLWQIILLYIRYRKLQKKLMENKLHISTLEVQLVQTQKLEKEHDDLKLWSNKLECVLEFDRKKTENPNTSNEVLLKEADSVVKGKHFEEFVAKIWKQYTKDNIAGKTWSFSEWRGDKYIPEFDIYAETNCLPDLTFRREHDSKQVSIECKYKTIPFDRDDFVHFKTRQIEKYSKYSKDYDIPVYLIMGTGDPKSPTELFVHTIQTEIEYEKSQFNKKTKINKTQFKCYKA